MNIVSMVKEQIKGYPGDVHIILINLSMSARGYSSVVEHSTADREVPGSTPGAPLWISLFFLSSSPFLVFNFILISSFLEIDFAIKF